MLRGGTQGLSYVEVCGRRASRGRFVVPGVSRENGVLGKVKGDRYFHSVIVCAGVGAVASGLALVHHFQFGHLVSSFCNINATFNCDLVNHSAYSTFAGIPVALIGLVAYILMAGLAVFQKDKPESPALLLLVSITGFAVSLYLTYIEAAILRTWCAVCLTSLLMIALITIFSALRVRADLRQERGRS